MSYKDLVIEYKNSAKSVQEISAKTDQFFEEKYFKGKGSKKKFSLPLIPGEIYSFEYKTDSKISKSRIFINRNPIVLCTGSYENNGKELIIRGIDLVCVPPEYRVKILEKIYDTFSDKIETNQKGLSPVALPLTYMNLKNLLSETGYESAVFGFKVRFMDNPHILDMEDWVKLPYLRKYMVEGLGIQGIYSQYQTKLI